jgi:hypothetical protein
MNHLRKHFTLISLLCLALLPCTGHADATSEIPDAKFQGEWEVKQHFFRSLQEGATDFDKLGKESAKGEFPVRLDIFFRRHDSGVIQQFWRGSDGKIARSKGITILGVTSNTLTYNAWSDHPTWKNILTIKEDGSAIFQVRSLKHQETFILASSKQANPVNNQPKANKALQ